MSGMIIGTRLDGAIMCRKANLVGVSQITVSEVMTVYTRDGEPLARVPLMARDAIFWARPPNKMWYWARTCDKASHSPIPIPLGYRGHTHSFRNTTELQWLQDHLNWIQLRLEQVIWPDEASFTLFLIIRPVFVWRTPAEEFYVDCLVPTMRHGLCVGVRRNIFPWMGISMALRGRIIDDHYRNILTDHLHPMFLTLSPRERPVMCDSKMTKPSFYSTMDI
ncbi:transposable element Tc1 transposase [Trichonephila clavipes]|nr:transposable element Tc1 transposase [Trichonephila clavipes]